MWHIKLKLTDTENSMVVTRGKGGEKVVKSKESQKYGDKRRYDFR